jgi:hypothetical protein
VRRWWVVSPRRSLNPSVGAAVNLVRYEVSWLQSSASSLEPSCFWAYCWEGRTPRFLGTVWLVESNSTAHHREPMSVASPGAEVGLFWLKTCTINGPSLDHEHESRVFASKSNRQQLTDGSSLVAESTRPLKITHGLHTAEARRNRPHSCNTQPY